MHATTEEAKTNALEMFFYGLLHMDVPSVGRPAETNLHLLCAKCCLEDLPEAMDDRDG